MSGSTAEVDMSAYTADIDIGGTFTDGFFTDGATSRTAKVLTTPHDLAQCFVACLERGAERFGVPTTTMLSRAVAVRLSTTLGTNTLLQQRGPRVGLLVTRGAEESLYGPDPQAVALGAFLRPDMVIGLAEHVDAAGLAHTAPDAEEVLEAMRALVSRGARQIAVSFANSWRNPVHERLVRAIAAARYPEHYLRSIPLQLGSAVSMAADDHARTNTVVLNAYLHPELARGLYRAEDLARERGLTRPLLVVHATGGCGRVAKTVAVQTLSSGPAAATGGAAALARHLGYEHVVTADMGGTSLDLAVLDGDGVTVIDQPVVHGIRLAVPMVRNESIGAGGGSIAAVVEGEVAVGPASAGSAPGPACYAKGGFEPTVTDANLVLGFLDPDRFLGGRMVLDRARAEAALDRRLGRVLGVGVQEVAARVRDRVDRAMGERLAERLDAGGHDSARFTLFAFGGGGPLHACAIAGHAGVRRVVGFPFGSVFSAFGSSTADVRHAYWEPVDTAAGDADARERVAAAIVRLERQGELDMRGEGFVADEVTHTVQLVVPAPDGGERRVPLVGPFDGDVDVRAVVLQVCAPIRHWLPGPAARLGTPPPPGYRPVRWTLDGAVIDTAVHRLEHLGPDAALDGPVLIEAADTSYAVPPGWGVAIDDWGNVVMDHRL